MGHMWLAPYADNVDRSPAHAMLVYLLARGAWPGYFEMKPDGDYGFVLSPPRTEREWQRTVRSVLLARPQQAASLVRDFPVFVAAPPGSREYLGGQHVAAWLDEWSACCLIQAAGAAVGMNGKLLASY